MPLIIRGNIILKYQYIYYMKRKTFIFTALAIAAIPFGGYWFSHRETDPLITPKELGKFCDDQQLQFIGETYLRFKPEENKKEKLINLLLQNETSEKVNFSNHSTLTKFLDEKILNNFSNGQFIAIDGWILSETEARQCALLSITLNNN